MIVGDGVLMEEVKKYLTEIRCAEQVEFTGWVPNEKIPYYLNKMKFHISPAFMDFPGTVNLEAMACGTIAIANGVDGVREIIYDYETGFLLKDNEPQTIADKLIEVIDHPGLEGIRQRAKSFVAQNFSHQRVLSDWQRILSKL
jgi:glycosyltransferase involved in cell wall biosynthesis